MICKLNCPINIMLFCIPVLKIINNNINEQYLKNYLHMSISLLTFDVIHQYF